MREIARQSAGAWRPRWASALGPRSRVWPVVVGVVAAVGFAMVPLFSGTSGVHGLVAPGSAGPSSSGVAPGAGATSVQPAARVPPTIGQVTISATGVSSNPSVVVVNVTLATATVLESFAGNITDSWAGSTLIGGGFTIDSTGYLSNSNVVGVAANGITVKDVATMSTGTTDGVLVSPAVTSATIESSAVTLTSESTTAVGIQAGNVFPASVVQPTGTFVVTGNTVNGPGGQGAPGEKGILVYGASVLILNNTVLDFSSETVTSGFSSWFEDIQSVGIYAGCAQASTTCALEGNTVVGSSVGIAYQLVTSGSPPQPITPGPATIEVNTLTQNLAYGLVLNATSASGTTIVEQNLVNNSVSGAPGMFLLGTTFQVTNNVLVGASTSGSNGPSQGEASCTSSIPTASIQASDCFNPTTDVTLNANIFEETGAAYWTATFPSNPLTSYLYGGELVTFSEMNLPTGTSWSVTIAGTNGTQKAPTSIVGELQNGTQAYTTVVSVAGFYQETLPASGTLVVSGSPLAETLVFLPLTTGQVVLTTTCASTSPSLVSLDGTTFTVVHGFNGNITDFCAGSTLDGQGYAITASGLPADANAVGIAANGITVDDVATVTTGYAVGGFPQTGIAVAPAITSATIENSAVTTTDTAGGPAWGIWAGNFAENPATQTVGTFTIASNTVRGPGGSTNSPLAGSIGIVAGGLALTITGNVVSGFSAVKGTGGHSGYNWWDGTQSLGVLAACAPGASVCLVKGNTLSDNAIGVTDILFTTSHGVGYQTGAVTIFDNKLSDSGGYGIYADMSASQANGGQPATGTSTISNNTIDNTLTGAPAMSLTGATFQVLGNTLIGTSISGDQGASQDQEGYLLPIPTASVEMTDFGNAWTGPTGGGVTHVTLETNFFLDTSVFWSASYDSGSASSQAGGELVTFSESGLVGGTSWSVTVTQVLDAVPFWGTSSVAAPGALTVDAQNGSYSYDVAHVAGYTQNQTSGTLTVNYAPEPVATVFTQVTYSVAFTESGLPSGTTWWVTLAGVKESSALGSITFTEPNGSLAYTAGTTAGYAVTPGTVVVAGANASVALSFSPVIYTVTFTESGLARGTEWWVNLSSDQSFHATTATISFLEANGSFAYHFGAKNGTRKEYAAPGGTLVVNAAPVAKSIAFTVLYPVTFHETVLPYGTVWWVNVTVGPAANTSTNGTTLVFWEGNGVYSYAGTPSDNQYYPVSGTFVVHNGGVSLKANFALVTYPVTVQERGLPPGVKWCVGLSGGKKHCSTRTSLTFDEPNGTYVYQLTSGRAGYFAPGGSFTVVGAGLVVPAVYTSTTYEVTFTQSGLPSATKWWVNITGEPSLSSTGATISDPLPNGNYTYSVASSVKTYSAPGGSFSVSGAAVGVAVPFAPSGGGVPTGGARSGAAGALETPLLTFGAAAGRSVGLWAPAATTGLLGVVLVVGRRGERTRGGTRGP